MSVVIDHFVKRAERRTAEQEGLAAGVGLFDPVRCECALPRPNEYGECAGCKRVVLPRTVRGSR